MKGFFEKLSHLVEAFFLLLILMAFKLLPIDRASALGGKLGRMIGPFLRAHRIADNNLQQVFPQYDIAARHVILTKMWDNLGRVAGEYPHLSVSGISKRITVEGAEYLLPFQNTPQGAVFVAGHFANWEICPLLGVLYKIPISFIYREANNPYADSIINWMRKDFRHMLFPKGKESAQQSIRTLQKKQCLAFLTDQKLNEGEAIPFFGYPAMTAVTATRLAIKYKVPVLALHVVRTDGAHFHVTVSPPIYYDAKASATKAMEEIHHMFENWIREHPEQWFWVHNRWNWKISKN